MASQLNGYYFDQISPLSGQFELTYYGGDEESHPPTLKLYYARTNNNRYDIQYKVETVASAQHRYSNPTGIEPNEFEDIKTYEGSDARLDEIIDLTGDRFTHMFDDQGYTYYAGTGTDYESSKELKVTYSDPDGDPPIPVPTATIYFTRSTDTSFRVQYYREKVDSTNPGDKNNYEMYDLKSFTGIDKLQVYTDAITGEHATQPTGISPAGDFRVRSDDAFKGFTFEPTLSDPQTTATGPTIHYGLTIYLYYSRSTNVDWKVEYYQQKINTSGIPINEWEHMTADDITTTSAPEGVEKLTPGKTG